MKSTLHLALVLSAVGFVALPARADMAPPENEPCLGKAAGAACTYGSAGTCQSQTCTKLDYAGWNHDASAGPPSTSYACVQCVTGTSTSTNTGTNTNTDGGDSPSNGDGACTIGKQSSTTRVAPWLLAAAFSSLFLIGRKRRR
jgi:hypothetical protein